MTYIEDLERLGFVAVRHSRGIDVSAKDGRPLLRNAEVAFVFAFLAGAEEAMRIAAAHFAEKPPNTMCRADFVAQTIEKLAK